jgi:hypothetical protein
MPTARSGHHGNISYVFEDAGFNTSPNDTSFKGFGGRARLTTFDAARQAERVYNFGRETAEIIGQNFEGGWEVTMEGLTEPPWWLAAAFGQPTSSNVSGALYDYSYDLANDNDPTSLRLYLPTDGFGEYEYIPGAVLSDLTVSQADDGSPEVVINGFYAEEPQRSSSLSPSVPAFGESSYSNRDAELLVDGDSVGVPQNTELSLATGARPIQGFGSDAVLDWVTGLWEPDVSWTKVIATDQTVDPLNRFKTGSQVNVSLDYDNGLTGEDAYTVNFDLTGSYPDEWSESGRNNPEENLEEQVNELAEGLTASVTTDAGSSGNPPGITL